MSDGEVQIVSRSTTPFSPWVSIAQKDVLFPWKDETASYHSILLMDYIAIFAQTPDKLIPIVRQYRPAVEQYTWELPAGLLDRDEPPEDACRRELEEETGLACIDLTYLGSYHTDTGRLENHQHVYYVRTAHPETSFVPEPGLEVRYVTYDELKALIREGQFQHQMHIACVFLYELFIAQGPSQT